MGVNFLFEDGSFAMGGWNNIAEGLAEPFEIRDNVEIPAGTYRFNQAMFQYFGSRSRRVSATGGFAAGDFYNGTIRSFNGGINVRPHRRLVLSVDYFRNRVSLPLEGGRFATNLTLTRAIFAFSPRAYIRSLFQYNDVDKEARANVLFRYAYRPGADIFIVYNEERDTGGSGWNITERDLLVKMTFYFVPF
jgi:hypothetical protein